jgi:hypothetical protein
MTKRVEYKQPLIANGSWNYLCDDDIVKHPFPPTEVTLHLRYLEATGNNVAAALLLDYFSYYCRRMSSDHGIEWITLSISDIQEDFMSAFGTRVITRALELLVELNLLSRRKDPNDPFQGSRQYPSYSCNITLWLSFVVLLSLLETDSVYRGQGSSR